MSRFLVPLAFAVCGLVLVLLTVYPGLDVAVSASVATQDGFLLRDNGVLRAMTKFVFVFSRLLVVLFLVAGLISLLWKRQVCGLSTKAWVYLFLALAIGPGLMANVVFKDHWGRARPRDIIEFGGNRPFSQAFVISESCARNCSFVSGDASFGFFLPSFAYVVPRRYGRRVFGIGMACGGVLSLARILLGAHFLSDVLAAMFLVLAVSAGLFMLLFGQDESKRRWWDFGGLPLSSLR
ncbi:MAG: phosphatase PAP2 family protein [Alphaproteobacteria bacterium]|nr:phosphatase PAP2 family protein [Alphaproteobacteria bacterium]